MVEFKIGERVIVSDEAYGINGKGIIKDFDASVCKVIMDTGILFWTLLKNIRDYDETPPQKIQQDGYEYELVGPVKPDWLVDGAWVVRKDNGETHQINQVSSDCFSATSQSSRVTGITAKRIADEFRPHTPEDFKWGDWAMYKGSRVFVVQELDHDEEIYISLKDSDWHNLRYVAADALTPTF